MVLREKALRDTAWDLTVGVLAQIKPEALKLQKNEVESIAFPKEVYLGPHYDCILGAAGRLTDVLIAASLLRLIVHVLNGLEQQEVLQTSSLEELAEKLIVQLETQFLQGKYIPGLEQVTGALRELFKQSPSVADSIFGLFLDLLPIKEEAEPIEILRRCVLKIIDSHGRMSTGFALCNCGHVLTAEHVVSGHKKMRITFRYSTSNGEKQELMGWAKVIHADQGRDVAILQVQGNEWGRFKMGGLAPPPLSLDWQPCDRLLCLGYQEQEIYADPSAVEAFIKPWDPILSVRFRDGSERDSLVLVIPHDYPTVVPGMSGGPVMNLRTRKVIATVTGATREAWVRQKWKTEEIWELISSARYGFAIPLSWVAESWPGFRECCLK